MVLGLAAHRIDLILAFDNTKDNVLFVDNLKVDAVDIGAAVRSFVRNICAFKDDFQIYTADRFFSIGEFYATKGYDASYYAAGDALKKHFEQKFANIFRDTPQGYKSDSMDYISPSELVYPVLSSENQHAFYIMPVYIITVKEKAKKMVESLDSFKTKDQDSLTKKMFDATHLKNVVSCATNGATYLSAVPRNVDLVKFISARLVKKNLLQIQS
nr:hypothetical protein BdHM001_35650 [Bdellovibrio sp. HM001]